MMENKALPSIVVWSWAAQISNSGEHFEQLLKEKLPSVYIKVFDSTVTNFDEESLEIWKKAEVVVLSPNLYEKFCELRTPKLRWLQFTSAGVDKFLRHAKKCGIQHLPYKVTRLADTYGTTMAEYVIAQIVSNERRFEAMREAQKHCHWNHKEFRFYRRLNQLTIGIVGAGSIGEEVARCCKCFGMKTIGLVRQERPQEKRSKFIDMYRVGTDELPLLVAESDYICSILPDCPETTDFFKGDIFSHATKKPVFMNIGRGNCIEDDTIITSIRKGWLSGAIIDVTRPEPLPKESRLWSVPEVIITPHTSGVVSDELIISNFYENWKKFVNNETLDHLVDVTKSY
ncbi:putative 2-ketogluconate reductase [Holothuria leucospilota]|uniref:2-ketogluconate reductase n=1 Tax=Holothuria leucospilota TaxID=206669 RepID=A0A9Q1C0U0_HOLLE|nr:putative 2-ketogluconate reductase [Holothuria leucospilota]